MIELEQTVKLFTDSDKTGKQFVNVDYEDSWIIVTHDSNSISLSIDNWVKLVALAEQLVFIAKNKSEFPHEG